MNSVSEHSDDARRSRAAPLAQRLWGGVVAWLGRGHGRTLPEHEPHEEPGQHVLRSTIMMIMIEGCTRSALAQALAEAGYAVESVWGLPAALDRLAQNSPSLIVLCTTAEPDACRAVRTATSVPILALVARVTESQLLAILDAGADDCQLSSIGKDEAMLRVRGLLRRQVSH